MIDGPTKVELGLLADAEARARGELPGADELLVRAVLPHARLEAAVREAARRGFPLTGTSLLRAAGKGPFVA